MIAIDNILVSDELVEAEFVCDLMKCKGGCCVDGDAGAPLQDGERQELEDAFEVIASYLTPEGLAAIAQQGKYTWDPEFGWVTPSVQGGICAYAHTDAKGIVRCGIEQAWQDGKIKWQKPISCHLFPVRISQSEDGETEYVNYEPRKILCNPGCRLGQQLKMPVYRFLKEALIRKYGEAFYNALDAVAKSYFSVR